MDTIETSVGDNRTGIMISPKEATKTMKGAIELTNPPAGDSTALGDNRARFMMEADPVGTMPAPASLKGLASSMKEKLMNGHHQFMDKLGERIAFERTGTRLYGALISKYMGTADRSAFPDIEMIRKFYLEEKRHFNLCCEVMLNIGGDPTAMTPSADVCGMAAMGWVQVMSDPRTTFLHSLEVILQAELVDNNCWENLIELADQLGLDHVVEDFRQALAEEENHLSHVRAWVKELNLKGVTVAH